MLNIQSVEYSKNPVLIGEAFLMQVTVSEVLGTWNDIVAKTWTNVSNADWQDLYYKILPASYGIWSEQGSKTWNTLQSNTWQDIRLKQE